MAARAVIDWSAPWLAPHAGLRPALEAQDWRGALTQLARARGVRGAGGHPIEFASGDDAPPGVAYEAHIAATGRVPSRDNLHDRFNALMWLAWPRLKRALNARQAAEIARLGISDTRGAARDAATLIDESGLLLACDDSALELLERRQWHALLVERRARWGADIAAFAFGHALLEKLVGPYKAITAAVLPVRGTAIEAIDAAAADFVARPDLTPRLLEHLPVLGIPGWCADNADARFYDDACVFRPLRSTRDDSVAPAQAGAQDGARKIGPRPAPGRQHLQGHNP